MQILEEISDGSLLNKVRFQTEVICAEDFTDMPDDIGETLVGVTIPKGTIQIDVINNSSYVFSFVPLFTEEIFPLDIILLPKTSYKQMDKDLIPLKEKRRMYFKRVAKELFPDAKKHGKLEIALTIQDN